MARVAEFMESNLTGMLRRVGSEVTPSSGRGRYGLTPSDGSGQKGSMGVSHMQWSRWVLVVSSGLLFTGCIDFFGLDDPEFDAGVRVIDAGAPIVPPSDPLFGSGTLDTARAVSGQFAWDAGGQLTATAADGTVFTLNVPALALVDQTPVTITMTPYATVNPGLGAESQYAVKLEPEGLQTTMQVMELSITPPAGTTWPIDEQIPFSYQGPSNAVNLALVRPTQDVKLVVPHFSSYGLALAKKGYASSLAAVRHRLGGDAEAQLELEVSVKLGEERRRALLGSSEGTLGDIFNDYLNRYIEQVLKPRFAARKDSCAAAKLFAQSYLGISRLMALLGSGSTVGTPDFSPSFSDVLDGDEVCMREEFELCRDNHIITRIMPAFLGVARQRALLGDPLTGQTALFDSRLADYVKKCLKFSLEVQSTVTLTSGTGNTAWRVTESMNAPNFPAEFVIATDLAGEPPNTAASTLGAIVAGVSFEPYTTSNFTQYYANSCERVSNVVTEGGTGSIAALAFTSQEGLMVDRARVKDFSLTLAVTLNQSRYDLTRLQSMGAGCGAQSSMETLRNNWTTGWSNWTSSLDPVLDDAYITGWTVNDNNAVLATKRVDWTDPSSNSVNTRFVADFTLRHVPDPM